MRCHWKCAPSAGVLFWLFRLLGSILQHAIADRWHTAALTAVHLQLCCLPLGGLLQALILDFGTVYVYRLPGGGGWVPTWYVFGSTSHVVFLLSCHRLCSLRHSKRTLGHSEAESLFLDKDEEQEGTQGLKNLGTLCNGTSGWRVWGGTLGS
jgi:hypothetical protein